MSNGRDGAKIKIDSAELLCVGTELLIGDIVNTNAAFISRELAELGINQYYQGVVGDNPERLSAALGLALGRSSLVIMTGGLGPTYDDLTKETAAAAFGRRTALHERSMERLRAMFDSRGAEMPESNLKQAYMPEGAVVFDNNNGTAPGCAIEDAERGRLVIMLPGPPREMQAMWRESVRPYLESYSDAVLRSRNVNLAGIGESSVELMLRELMRSSLNPTIAPYCTEAEVRLRVTARARSAEEAEALCDEAVEKIRASEAGPYIYGVDTSLEEAVLEALRLAGATLACAESCTGGLIAKSITDVPGCSDVFFGGAVTYANSVKSSLAGVKEETLAAFGAVSPEVAMEMAAGIRKATGATLAVSTTGIAGPGGGSGQKPVGLVYIGLCDGSECSALRFNFIGDRSHVRKLAANAALARVLEWSRSAQASPKE